MFSKLSRYRLGVDEVALDADGRRLLSKALRPYLPVDGSLQHTVEANDSLSRLATKYYRQSRDWWRLCDANDALDPIAFGQGLGPVKVPRARSGD